MRGLLLRQSCQLAVRAPRVFILSRRLVQHRPHALACTVAQQHRQQLVAIEPVGLGAPGVPVHFDAGGVDHDVVDALLGQPAVQPPAVPAGFVAGIHLGLRLELAALPGLAYALHHRGHVAGLHTLYRLAPRRPSLIVSCHFLSLSSKLMYRSAWIAVSCLDWAIWVVDISILPGNESLKPSFLAQPFSIE